MFKCFILMLFLTVSAKGFASADHQMIDTLGTSPKGQFVALEEYGYKSHNHSYYVRIKVLNVWTKEYVGKSIDVEIPAHRPLYLKKVRAKAKLMAVEELKKFQISV